MDLLDLYHKSLRHPIDADEEEWVREVIEEYPYFSLPYYLLARKSGDQEEVFIAATHSPDRSLLRNYMEGRSIFQVPVPPQKEQPKVILRKNRSVEKELAYAEHDHNMLFSLLDFEQLSNKANNPNELLSIYPSAPKRKIDEFTNTKVKELSVRYLHLFPNIKGEIRLRLGKKQKISKQAVDLMQSKSQKPISFSKNTQSKPKRVIPQTPSSNKVKPKRQDSKPPVSEVSGMLDKFLQNRPSPKEMLARASSMPDENAVDSISRDDEMVTETLAKLHVRQKNYKEALKIYYKLRLLFPEKSAYFDGQIEQIEQKI